MRRGRGQPGRRAARPAAQPDRFDGAQPLPDVPESAEAGGRDDPDDRHRIRGGVLPRDRSQQRTRHARQVQGQERVRDGNRQGVEHHLRRPARPWLRPAHVRAPEPRQHDGVLRRKLSYSGRGGIRIHPAQPRRGHRARHALAGGHQRHRVLARAQRRAAVPEGLQLQLRRRAPDRREPRQPRTQGDAGDLHLVPGRPGRRSAMQPPPGQP